MHPKKVLVVDDSLVVLKALSMKLRSCGYKVSCAEECSTALQIARRERPELILLDVSFPPAVDEEGVAWDGFRVKRKFRGQWIEITVKNPGRVCKGVKALTVNGRKISGNLIPVDMIKEDLKVEVELG